MCSTQELNWRALERLRTRLADTRHRIIDAARALSRSVGLRLVRPHRGGLRVRFPVGAGNNTSPKDEVDAWCRLALAQRDHDRAVAKLHQALAGLRARRAKKGRRSKRGGRS